MAAQPFLNQDFHEFSQKGGKGKFRALSVLKAFYELRDLALDAPGDYKVAASISLTTTLAAFCSFRPMMLVSRSLMTSSSLCIRVPVSPKLI